MCTDNEGEGEGAKWQSFSVTEMITSTIQETPLLDGKILVKSNE